MLINKKIGKNHGEFQNNNEHPELVGHIAATFASCNKHFRKNIKF